MKFPFWFLFFSVLSPSLSAAEEVSLSLVHLPPGMVDQKLEANLTGFVSVMLDAIEQASDNELDFKHQFTTVKRVLLDFKLGKEVIFPALTYSNERQKFIYYSSSSPFARLPVGVFIRRNNLDKFKPFLTAEGEIDLRAVVADGGFKSLMSSGRAYDGLIIKDLTGLLKSGVKSGVVSDMEGYSIETAVQFLLKSRIDFLIEFPLHVKFSLKEQIKEVLFLPIAADLELKDNHNFALAAMAAPRNEWGKDIMSKLNMLMYKKSVIEASSEAYKQFLPVESHDYYDKFNAEYLAIRPSLDEILIDY